MRAPVNRQNFPCSPKEQPPLSRFTSPDITVPRVRIAVTCAANLKPNRRETRIAISTGLLAWKRTPPRSYPPLVINTGTTAGERIPVVLVSDRTDDFELRYEKEKLIHEWL